MRRAEKAWLAIGGIVIANNVTAEPGGTLSEVVDDWLIAHPVLTRTVIALFALHLANAVAARYDPIHLVFTTTQTWRRRRVVVVVEAA
jgi:hypothetical protein